MKKTRVLVTMDNRLRPFVPHGPLHIVAWRATDVSLDVEDMYAEYGFRVGSKQHNFLTQSRTGVVVLLHNVPQGSPVPRHLAHPSVVARAFGVVRTHRGVNELELWHISVRKQHPLNDSRGGTRWGVHGIRRVDNGGLVRWTTATGSKLTKRNALGLVKGTPNPYAMECLVRFAQLFDCKVVAQNPEMPCAQLFDSQYCHRTHPATLLLYRALGFKRPPHLDHFVWNGSIPLQDAMARALERMARGESVVV